MPLGFGQFPPQSYQTAPQMSARPSGHRWQALVEPALSASGIYRQHPAPIASDDPPVDTAAWTNRPPEGYESPKDVFGRPKQ